MHPKHPTLRRVDVHAHYLPGPYHQALMDAGFGLTDGGMPVPVWNELAHLSRMEQSAIGFSVLSISSPGVSFLPPISAAALAREVNEYATKLCAEHPGKFGYFATLPCADSEAMLRECRYALDTLNADGVCLETNADGRYVGDPYFDRLLDLLDERSAILYLHPTSPPCLEQVGLGLPGPLIEFPFDTTRAVVRLIYGGAMRRHPHLRIILSHAGGALPLLVPRIAGFASTRFASPRPEGGASEVYEQVRRLYFDLALASSPAVLEALLRITSLSHLLYGSDFPWAPRPAIDANDSQFAALLERLSPVERQMISYGNAADLFPRLRAFIEAPILEKDMLPDSADQ